MNRSNPKQEQLFQNVWVQVRSNPEAIACIEAMNCANSQIGDALWRRIYFQTNTRVDINTCINAITLGTIRNMYER